MGNEAEGEKQIIGSVALNLLLCDFIWNTYFEYFVYDFGHFADFLCFSIECLILFLCEIPALCIANIPTQTLNGFNNMRILLEHCGGKLDTFQFFQYG